MFVNGRVAKRASLASTIASESAKQSPFHHSLTHFPAGAIRLFTVPNRKIIYAGAAKRLSAAWTRSTYVTLSSYPTRSSLSVTQRHLRSEGGAECRQYHQRTAPSTSILADDQRPADS